VAITEWGCTLARAFSRNECHILLKIKMLQLDADQLGNPQA
jgi:hypothetical protein